MKKFLESNDPYIIIIGIEKLEREINIINHSISLVSGKLIDRENRYKNDLNYKSSILNKLKIKYLKITSECIQNTLF